MNGGRGGKEGDVEMMRKKQKKQKRALKEQKNAYMVKKEVQKNRRIEQYRTKRFNIFYTDFQGRFSAIRSHEVI